MDLFGYKIDVFHISCTIYSFVFHRNSSVRLGSPWLFRTCFHTKIFGKRNFCTLNKIGSITILLGPLKIRNIFSEFSQKSIVKNMNMSFLNVMICYYFSLETVLLSWLKINLREKQINVEIQATLKHGPA